MNILEVAVGFAGALDRSDFRTVAGLLHAECVYMVRGCRHVGVESILAAYRKNDDWGRQLFDEIGYEHRVEPAGTCRMLITFIDHLGKQGKRHTFQCQQTIEFDEAGKITSIEHRDLPGEVEALDRYFAECGISCA